MDNSVVNLQFMSPKARLVFNLYTADIDEESLENHLMPLENRTKEEIASFFVDELRKIKNELA